MRRLIDPPALWQEAAEILAQDRRQPGLRLPPDQPCPLSLDDLLSRDFDVDRAVAKIKL